MKKAIPIAGATAASPFALVLAIAMSVGGSGVIDASTAAATAVACQAPVTTGSAAGDGTNLSTSQVGNAQIIYNVSVAMALPSRAATIAIATAMQESRLENLTVAVDHDSLGLFQQRPSAGWGTPAQVTDPVYASKAFYDHLVLVPNWQTLPLTQAAQAVQISGFPDAYAQWETLASGLVATFSGAATACASDNGGAGETSGGGTSTTLPAGFTLPPGTPVKVQIAVAFALAQLGKPYVWGGVGPSGWDCSGLVMMAYQKAGVSIPRTSSEQALVGTPIYNPKDIQPGDLLFIAGTDGTPQAPGHVGMAIGNGLIVEAPHTGLDVLVGPIAGYWMQNLASIRRYVQ